MYKCDYYTKDQMTKYKMKADINKTWLYTLQFCTKLFAQRKAYRDNCAANSGFDSAAHINDIPTDRSLVSTSSDFTTRNLYIESLEESLAAGREYVAKECAPTLDKSDPANLLPIELDAQQKQFKLIIQQNSALLAAMAKGNGDGGGGGGSGSGGGGGGGGRGGGGGGGGNKRRDQGIKAICPNCNKLVIHTVLPANKDNIPTWYKPLKLDLQGQGSLNSFDINDWIMHNKPTSSPPTITLRNYWTLLASQVKVLDPPPCPPESLLLACQRDKHVRFNLPSSHTNKDSTNYQQCKHCNNDDITRCDNSTPVDVCQGVLNGSIPLAVSDTAATSKSFLPSAPTLPTSTVSTAMFHPPNGATAAATMIHKLHCNLREQACSVNIVPSLVGNSLLITVKMVEAGYTAIYDDKEVNFYNTTTTNITVSKDAIFKGGQCPWAKLWCVPLIGNACNKNTDTLLLNHPHKHDCLNSFYEAESTTTTQEHINAIMLQTIGREYIHNMYKLPSIESTIRYLHAAAGFLVEKTWLKAIQRGNYNSWPLINITNVACYFPESKEMQKGHMHSQR
jgi:hypothetical protein